MDKTNANQSLQSLDLNQLQKLLPHGIYIAKKGGRPRKEDRDRAVHMAWTWRTLQLNETPNQAEKWILEEWLAQYKGEKMLVLEGELKTQLNILWSAMGGGISEGAHVRRYNKKGADLLKDFLMCDLQHLGFIALESRGQGDDAGIIIRENGECWLFKPEFPIALRLTVKDLKITKRTFTQTPIFQAISRLQS